MTFLDQFERLKENNRLEFKLVEGGFPKSLCETYSALTNTAGVLLFKTVSRIRTHQVYRQTNSY